jgi:hypothetical protein
VSAAALAHKVTTLHVVSLTTTSERAPTSARVPYVHFVVDEHRRFTCTCLDEVLAIALASPPCHALTATVLTSFVRLFRCENATGHTAAPISKVTMAVGSHVSVKSSRRVLKILACSGCVVTCVVISLATLQVI